MVRMNQKHSLEGQVYSVPLIQSDLRREEAVHQITDALLYLDTISTDIFRRVSESVEKNRRQLQIVTDRIRLAQARVDKIKGSKKATKVFSSAKYPAPDRLQDYSSIFTGAADPSSQSRPRQRIQNKLRPFDEKALQTGVDPMTPLVSILELRADLIPKSESVMLSRRRKNKIISCQGVLGSTLGAG